MKIKHFIIATIISFIPAVALADVWYPSGSALTPVVSTWSIKLPSLTGLSCLGTDGSGIVQAGTCGGGGGSGGGTFSTSTLFGTTLGQFPYTNLVTFLTNGHSTSTSKWWFNPLTNEQLIGASTTIGDHLTTSYITATSSTASFLKNASTTNFSVTGTSNFGTIQSGLWNGTAIDTGFGGTGLTTVGASSTVLQSNGSTLKFNPLFTSELTNDSGFLTSAVTSVTGTFPIISSGGNTPAISFGGLSTSSAAVLGNVPYFTGANTFANEATGTITCAGTASCGAGSYVLGSNLTITGSGGTGSISTSSGLVSGQVLYATGVSTVASVATSTLTPTSPLGGSFTQLGSGGSVTCTTASAGVAGCLNSSDWSTFNNKQATFTGMSPNSIAFWSSATALGGTTSPTVGYLTATTTTPSSFINASTTNLSASNLCIGTVCNTSWPAGSGTVTSLTAGTNITFSSGATCTTTCTINGSAGTGNFLTNVSTNTYLNAGSNLEAPTFQATSTATSTFAGIIEVGSGWLTNNSGSFLYSSSTNDSLIIGAGAGSALITQNAGDWENTAIGSGACSALVVGASADTCVGAYAGHAMSTGQHNSAFGDHAMRDNTTGSENTFTGYGAGFSQNGGDNVGTGNSTLYHTLGNHNTADGQLAGFTNIVGDNNIFIGTNAGYLTNASSSIIIGSGVDSPYTSTNGVLNIGNVVYGSNMFNDSNVTLSSATHVSKPTTNGSLGISTTSPGGKFAIALNGSDTMSYPFIISSSTAAFATTTIFRIDDTGSTTATNGFNISAGCFAVNSVCITSGGGGGVTSVTGTGEITSSGGNTPQISYTGLSTSSAPVSAGLFYAVDAVRKVATVATTSIGCSGFISCTGFNALGSASTITTTGTLTTANGGTNHGNFTAGSIPFAGAGGTSLTENNSNLFWDNLHTALGIGTSTPQWALEISTSTASQLTLSDAGANHWSFRTATDGNLYIGTSSPTTYATSTPSAIQIKSVGNPAFAFGTTTTTGILNLGPNPATTNATSTILMGKIQIDGFASGGGRVCASITGTSWVITSGACPSN